MRSKLLIICILLLPFSRAKSQVLYAWIGDTTKVELLIQKEYVDCRTLSFDTMYFPKRSEKFEQYVFYYDSAMKMKSNSYLIVNDTCTSIYYYRNGQMMRREVFAPYSFYGGEVIRKTTWCPDGTVSMDHGAVERQKLLHVTVYYCNGQVRFQGASLYFFPYDTLTWYYENGQISKQEYYTHYNPDSLKQQRSKEISRPRKWTREGDSLPVIYDDDGINTLGGATEYCSRTDYGCTPYAKVDKTYWHTMNMEVMRDSLYGMIKKPDSCYCTNGRIVVGFFLEKDGSITGLRIDADVDPLYAYAVKNAFAQLGKWPPATVNGVPVRTYYPLYLSVESMK